ncbi:MAG: DoxX family protein [Xanthomonadales bacterium]|nr:DoxX family protein [Xanthomonadales bacterium]
MSKLFAKISPWADLAGRFLMAFIFMTTGYGKIGGFEGTQGFMESMGVPGELLPLVIITELGGGLLLMLGLFTRYTALALAGFTILAGYIFHGGSEDMMQQIMLAKNMAIAGGFLVLVANGAGKFSLDRRFGRS